MAEDSGDEDLEPDQDVDKAYLDSDTYEREADRQQSEFFNNGPKIKRQDLNKSTADADKPFCFFAEVALCYACFCICGVAGPSCKGHPVPDRIVYLQIN